MGLCPEGKGTILHALLFCNGSNSTFMACWQFGSSIASIYYLGSVCPIMLARKVRCIEKMREKERQLEIGYRKPFVGLETEVNWLA